MKDLKYAHITLLLLILSKNTITTGSYNTVTAVKHGNLATLATKTEAIHCEVIHQLDANAYCLVCSGRQFSSANSDFKGLMVAYQDGITDTQSFLDQAKCYEGTNSDVVAAFLQKNSPTRAYNVAAGATGKIKIRDTDTELAELDGDTVNVNPVRITKGSIDFYFVNDVVGKNIRAFTLVAAGGSLSSWDKSFSTTKEIYDLYEVNGGLLIIGVGHDILVTISTSSLTTTSDFSSITLEEHASPDTTLKHEHGVADTTSNPYKLILACNPDAKAQGSPFLASLQLDYTTKTLTKIAVGERLASNANEVLINGGSVKHDGLGYSFFISTPDIATIPSTKIYVVQPTNRHQNGVVLYSDITDIFTEITGSGYIVTSLAHKTGNEPLALSGYKGTSGFIQSYRVTSIDLGACNVACTECNAPSSSDCTACPEDKELKKATGSDAGTCEDKVNGGDGGGGGNGGDGGDDGNSGEITLGEKICGNLAIPGCEECFEDTKLGCMRCQVGAGIQDNGGISTCVKCPFTFCGTCLMTPHGRQCQKCLPGYKGFDTSTQNCYKGIFRILIEIGLGFLIFRLF